MVLEKTLESPLDLEAAQGAPRDPRRDSRGERIHALEKEMATHCSVLAWRIPRTGEPGRLLSMGSHSAKHLVT